MRPKLALTTVILMSLQCVIAAQAQTHGPLRVHPENPRYFTDDSGKAILLAGSHTWPNLVDMGPSDPPPAFDFDAYLAWLEELRPQLHAWLDMGADQMGQHTGMKAVQWRNGNHYVAPHPWPRTGPGLASTGRPKFDLEQHNPEYLERICGRACQGAARRVCSCPIMLFEGYGVQFQRDAWPNHPFNPANNINGDRR